MCVQSFDDSQNSAIHISYRILLRSSSMQEPRYPLPKVVNEFHLVQQHRNEIESSPFNRRSGKST